MGKELGHQPLGQRPIETPPDQFGPDAHRPPSFIETPRTGPLGRRLGVIQIPQPFELVERGDDLVRGNAAATETRFEFPFGVGAAGQISVGQLAGGGWVGGSMTGGGTTPPLIGGWRRRSGWAGSFIDRTARS